MKYPPYGLSLGLLLAGCATPATTPSQTANTAPQQVPTPAVTWQTTYKLTKSFAVGALPLMTNAPCNELVVQPTPGEEWLRPPVPWSNAASNPYWEETWSATGCGAAWRITVGFTVDDVSQISAGKAKLTSKYLRFTRG
jgi:hypothetical protein